MASTISQARSLAARTVHIRISPSARSFRECREVLLELEEKCGEIAMFRSLKYHPTSPVQNAALAVFQTESAAQKALNQTPFVYGVIIEKVQPMTYIGPPMSSLEDPTAENKPEEKKEEKWFQLDISPSDFVHEKYIKSTLTNPLYGPYKPVRTENSFIAGALKQSVPPSLWARGLIDWETDSVRRRSGMGLEAALEGKDDGIFNRVARIQDRHRNRQEKTIPVVMKGLRALKEERQRRDAEAEAIREDIG